MRRSVFYLFVVMSMMVAGTAVAVDPADSTHDGLSPPGPVLPGSHAPCQGGETVLVIQDNVEWFAPDDPSGNVVSELIAQGRNWCSIHSNQLAAASLAPFGEIIIPAAQNQTFYDNLFPGGVIHAKLDAWVLSGGVLSANLTDDASGPGASGNWFGDTFVGGVLHTNDFRNDVDIAAAGHPIITGTAPCPSGNCGAIIDAGTHNDLDGWGSSTHGHFTNLPGGTTVILVDSSGRPVMIEYAYGSGVVIATMTTTEWMYAGNFGTGAHPRNKKLLANEIAYQDSLVRTLDHFKCYGADGEAVDVTVDLKDQFGVEPQVEVDEPELFCNPVAKTHTGEVTEIDDPTAHLTAYEIENDEDVERQVTVSNQFGDEQTLEVEGPGFLFVPSEKDGVGSDLRLDHFTCYEADGEAVDVTVDLEDQFGVEVKVQVDEPELFCNPVAKTHTGKVTPILNPQLHLTCYEIDEDEDDDEEERDVLAGNQFGDQALELEDPELLCVPSEKTAVG